MPVRIYDISKKLGLENKEVLTKAKALGIIAARVASSSLDKITAEYLEEQIIKDHPHLAAPPPPPPVPAPHLPASPPVAPPTPTVVELPPVSKTSTSSPLAETDGQTAAPAPTDGKLAGPAPVVTGRVESEPTLAEPSSPAGSADTVTRTPPLVPQPVRIEPSPAAKAAPTPPPPARP